MCLFHKWVMIKREIPYKFEGIGTSKYENAYRICDKCGEVQANVDAFTPRGSYKTWKKLPLNEQGVVKCLSVWTQHGFYVIKKD